MLIVGSRNAEVGMAAGWAVLAADGSALDTVEAVVREVETSAEDHTVGYGGYPNLLGEVELDASVMDGDTRRAGAVGALRGHRHAVSVAREVMDRLPHILLVDRGAARLAALSGIPEEALLTAEAERVWRAGLEGRLPPEFRSGAGIVGDMLSQAAHLAADPEHVDGTVNVIARDGRGSLASAVSTSGWAWKFPGRVGDSAVIGAGNYADSRYGAAACTGWGELAIRCRTAGAVVSALRNGSTLEGACLEAIADIASLEDLPQGAVMSLVTVDAAGQHCAVSSSSDAEYVWREGGMSAHQTTRRIHVPLGSST